MYQSIKCINVSKYRSINTVCPFINLNQNNGDIPNNWQQYSLRCLNYPGMLTYNMYRQGFPLRGGGEGGHSTFKRPRFQKSFCSDQFLKSHNGRLVQEIFCFHPYGNHYQLIFLCFQTFFLHETCFQMLTYLYSYSDLYDLSIQLF